MPAKITAPAEQVLEWAKWYRESMSMRDIAKAIGRSPNFVRDRFIEHGIQIDRKDRHISAKARGRPSPRKGAKLTQEQRAAVGRRMRGNKYSVGRIAKPETLQKMRSWVRKPEMLQKMHAAAKAKNVKYAPETKRQLERLRQALKRFVSRVLKATGRRKEIPSERYLGYSRRDLLEHLGPRQPGYEIDHKVPIVEFFRRGIHDPAIVNALPNLQWLPKRDNIEKSATVPHDADAIIASCFEDRARRLTLKGEP